VYKTAICHLFDEKHLICCCSDFALEDEFLLWFHTTAQGLRYWFNTSGAGRSDQVLARVFCATLCCSLQRVRIPLLRDLRGVRHSLILAYRPVLTARCHRAATSNHRPRLHAVHGVQWGPRGSRPHRQRLWVRRRGVWFL